ncbi:MAG: hypothetical protein ACRDHM_11645 [Actinomycetota bacterium]
MTRALSAALLTAAISGGPLLGRSEQADAQTSVGVPQKGPAEQLRCTAADEPLNFPTYWVGPSFDSLDLTGVLRSCHSPPGPAPGVNNVSYLYGDCDASRGGCGLPIEIQSWPSSVRHKGWFSVEPETVAGTVAGVPAEIWDSGLDVEIFMPDVTVVVFGDDPDRVDRAVEALVEGPDVLVELAAHGLVFDSECVSERGYCQADPVQKNSIAGSLLVGVALFFLGPMLAIAFRPPPVSSRRVKPAG